MNIKEAICKRRSVRGFTGKKIPVEIINELVEYANLAPSAGNLQARDFIIVDDSDVKKQLAAAALNQVFISEAPVNIVVCANLERIKPYGRRGRELYAIQDSAAAVEHILLLAASYNLGTCWVGAFNEEEVADILKLPSYVKPVAIIPIGYPKGDAEKTSRINPRSLMHYNQW